VSHASYALITGASGGIGLSLATELAKLKANLLLVARSEDKLSALAKDLSSRYQVKAEYLPIDLTKPSAAQEIVDWVNKNAFPVNILVNNAGYGLWGAVEKTPLDKLHNMMQLNMNAVVDLTYLLLPVLRKEQQSYILNVASTAAYQAVPTLATYAATKSFVLLFTRGLRKELVASNVSVTCLSPGATSTDFIDRAGMNSAIKEKAEKFTMTSEAVAKIALKGMFKKKAEVIPGFVNWLSVQLTYLMPKAIPENIAEGLYKTNP
jgi:short-subunit dehydrogenase